MTDLLSRPRPDPDVVAVPAAPLPRPAALSALFAAVWSAAACLAACCAVSVAGWLAGSTGTAAGALRVGAVSWLLAHGSGVQLPSESVSLLPLGITGIAALLLYRSGRWVASSSAVASWRPALVGVGSLAGSYAALVSGVALLSAAPQARPHPLPAAAGAVVLAALSGGVGVLRASGLLAQLAAALHVELRAALRGAAAGVLVMTVAGALLVAASLVTHLSLAEELASSLPGGGVAQVLLLALIGVVLLPNAVLCAGAFALGPGFALGLGTFVTPTQVHLGQLPLLPLLAALPAEGAQPGRVSALVAVPVVAGGIAAVVALRRHRVEGLTAHAVRGGFAGAAAGAAFGLLTALAVASGPGRLSELGPAPLACVLAGVTGMGMGGVLAGAVLGVWPAKTSPLPPGRLGWLRSRLPRRGQAASD